MFTHAGALAVLESLHRNWNDVVDGVLLSCVYIMLIYRYV